MTADAFRKIALNFPEALESAHMNHPDFRVGGRIFATLGYPDEDWATIKLTPKEQRSFVRADPDVFRHCPKTPRPTQEIDFRCAGEIMMVGREKLSWCAPLAFRVSRASDVARLLRLTLRCE
jgi:hypothetical protein